MWAMCVLSGLTLAVHAWTLKGWSRGWKQAAKATARDDAPSQADFGIVIPCRNEEGRLPHLLDDLVVALRDQPALSQIQVVVVDETGLAETYRKQDRLFQDSGQLRYSFASEMHSWTVE